MKVQSGSIRILCLGSMDVNCIINEQYIALSSLFVLVVEGDDMIQLLFRPL